MWCLEEKRAPFLGGIACLWVKDSVNRAWSTSQTPSHPLQWVPCLKGKNWKAQRKREPGREQRWCQGEWVSGQQKFLRRKRNNWVFKNWKNKSRVRASSKVSSLLVQENRWTENQQLFLGPSENWGHRANCCPKVGKTSRHRELQLN